MLNLTQRLLLGCVVIAALAVGLVAITHRALAAAGDSFISVAFIVSIVLVEIATIVLVLHPIKMLADDLIDLLRNSPASRPTFQRVVMYDIP